jgi:putative choline sulfate-utilization transcription factor
MSRSLPPLNALLAFEAAAHSGSFTAAAKQLGSTQSAISQQIRGLEEALGKPLFTRIYRGVVLNESGEALYGAVSLGFDQIRETVKKLQQVSGKRRINVATDFACAAYWLVPRLSSYREQHPDTEVRIITAHSYTAFEDADDVDLLIRYCSVPPKLGTAIPLFHEEVYPICSPYFLKEYGDVKSHKGLAQLPLLALRQDHAAGWMDWLRLFEQRGSQVLPSKPIMEFDNYTLLVQSAIAGQGVGLGWGTLIDDLVERGVLVALSDFSVNTQGGYYLFVSDKSHYEMEGLKALVNWLSVGVNQ